MRSFRLDWWLVAPAVLLVILGLTVLRSVAADQLRPQLYFVAVAVVAFVVFNLIDYRILFAVHVPAYVFSMGLLVLPMLFGAESRGALRWLQVGSVSLQPSEIIKPFLLMTFSVLAAGSFKWKRFWLVAAYLLPVVLVFIQPDLGTAMVLTVGWLVVFASQVPRRWLVVLLGLGMVVSPLFWLVLKDYQKDRLLTFVNPYRDPLGKGYHVIQSTIAVGSGQWWGRGLGHGTQSQLRFLPERHTDFIFASLSEELGFVGSILVVGLFLLLFYRLYYYARMSSDLAAALFCLGNLSLLAFQVFVNVGMNMGVAPVTGITLPFLSAGGSSLVSLAITLGIVSSISHQVTPRSLPTFQIG